MAKGKTNVPAVQEEKSNVPAVYDYGEDAGQGFQNQGREDYSIPFISVLQSNSPQVETLADAKAGMLINTVTNELFKHGIAEFIPVLTQHVYVEWVPRESSGGGSGFVAVHALNSEVVKAAKESGGFGKLKVGANDLVETFYVYGLQVTEAGAEQAVIGFSSTKVKKYKGWMTQARSIQIKLPDGRRINPPLFAHKYKIGSVKERNNKGEFWNFDIALAAGTAAECRIAPNDPLYQTAKGLLEMIQSGVAKADHSSQGAAGDGGATVDEGAAPF